MIKATELAGRLPARYNKLLEADLREIDNPDPYRPACRNYIDRITKVVSLVQARWPDPKGVRVAEIGTAQSNISLLLAESGYTVRAFEINADFIAYSKKKREKGNIRWVNRSFDCAKAKGCFDAIIMAELIEHCAYPEDMVAKGFKMLNPGGILVLTTPNGSRLKNDLPTFSHFASRKSRKELEKRQFGPTGEDHLFLFTLSEAISLVPPKARLLDAGYLGGSLAFNSLTHHLLRPFPLSVYKTLTRLSARLPLFNSLSFHNLYLVIEKSRQN